MTERELAAEAGNDVPGNGESGKEVRVGDDVQPKEIPRQQQERQQGHAQSRGIEDRDATP